MFVAVVGRRRLLTLRREVNDQQDILTFMTDFVLVETVAGQILGQLTLEHSVCVRVCLLKRRRSNISKNKHRTQNFPG